MWKTKEAKCVVDHFSKKIKCVVDFSQSINSINGVGESKRIHGIIVYICPYLFSYNNTLAF